MKPSSSTSKSTKCGRLHCPYIILPSQVRPCSGSPPRSFKSDQTYAVTGIQRKIIILTVANLAAKQQLLRVAYLSRHETDMYPTNVVFGSCTEPCSLSNTRLIDVGFFLLLSPYAILIPFPPPPALALIMTGYPISSAILTASSPDSMMPYGFTGSKSAHEFERLETERASAWHCSSRREQLLGRLRETISTFVQQVIRNQPSPFEPPSLVGKTPPAMDH